MSVIDAHTHFFPDAVARKAIPRMEENSGQRAFHDGTLAGLVASMDQAGIGKSIVLPVATNPDKVGSVNLFSASVASPRVAMSGALHPKAGQWRAHLDQMLGLGFRAVKFHPDYQEFRPDDPACLDLFAALRDAGVLVIFHAGEDLSYQPPAAGPPASIAALLDRLPGLAVYATHLGGFRMWDEVLACLAGRGVYMDTSFSFGYASREMILRLIRANGADYVLYGSDSPWLDQRAELENVRGLGLPPAAEEKILCANALRLLEQFWPDSRGERTNV